MANVDVVGVGNALVDVQARVDDSVLPELGIDKGVMTLVDDAQQKAVLEKLKDLPLNRCAGGSANSIVAIAEFGGSATYVGKVGRDEVGQFFLTTCRVSASRSRGNTPKPQPELVPCSSPRTRTHHADQSRSISNANG